MRSSVSITIGLGVALSLVLTGAAYGATDEEKCAAAKMKEAGKYGFCRMKAEATSVKKGEPVDYSKCDGKFSKGWKKAEFKGGGACPTDGDEGAIQAQVTADTDALVTALGPTPPSECNVLTQDCPIGSEACFVNIINLDPVVTLCGIVQFPGNIQGVPCQFVNGCAEGFGCVLPDPPDNPSGLACAFHCDALGGGGPTCADGPGPAFECRAINDFYGDLSTAPADLGMCVDPLEFP